MRRNLGQMSFADGLVNQRAGRNEWLFEIEKMIDWSAVSEILSPIYSSPEGRSSYPVLTYVRLLLIQQWYDRASNFEHVSFKGADLRRADLRRSDFVNCVFDGASTAGMALTRMQGRALRLSVIQRLVIDWRNDDGEEPDGG